MSAVSEKIREGYPESDAELNVPSQRLALQLFVCFFSSSLIYPASVSRTWVG